MVLRILFVNFLVALVFMSLWYLVARFRKRIDTVDIGWGLSFIVGAWAVMIQQPTGRSLVIAILITIWGSRLAWHIYSRSRRHGDDPRYKKITEKWKGNIWLQAWPRIYLVQGVLSWLVSLPIIMAASKMLSGWEWLIFAGTFIWVTGFAVETVADRQLRKYLAHANRPKVMDRGLWAYSRHPNYFGELVQWWGIGIIALSTQFGIVGLIGPALISYLIIFVSGIPPIENRKKTDPDYAAYMKRTSALILWPPKHP